VTLTGGTDACAWTLPTESIVFEVGCTFGLELGLESLSGPISISYISTAFGWDSI
jgi:hypothetical protein